ncbi:MAG: prenyltransferase [Candidatus Omnitrophica bacterium]|nr:prenyltransferase [Candidatus Omnitrophota bacterium]
MEISLLIKATRINFIPASVIPLFMGIAMALRNGFEVSPLKAVLCMAGVVSAHIAGNVVNDICDHKSGADLVDDRRSPFFGGSKVIKDGLLGSREMLLIAIVFFSVSSACGFTLFLMTKDPVILIMMIAAGVLTVGYSAPPLKLSYRGLGEADIFLLFGVLPVAGVYYVLTQKAGWEPVMLSLPIAFLITSVIFCNEVPDFPADRVSGKLNMISLTGPAVAYRMYIAIVLLAYLCILLNVIAGFLSPIALVLCVFSILGIKAALAMKKSYNDIEKMIVASGWTIALHFLTGAGLITITFLK